jgi:hypothetical protein
MNRVAAWHVSASVLRFRAMSSRVGVNGCGGSGGGTHGIRAYARSWIVMVWLQKLFWCLMRCITSTFPENLEPLLGSIFERSGHLFLC